MKPRLGLPTDAGHVTDVILKAMPLDPQWDYRFPYRLEYPEDHYTYTRMLFDYFLDPDYDDWVVMVVEDTLEAGEDTKIVAFGVFNISFRNKRAHGPGYQAQDRKSHFPCHAWKGPDSRLTISQPWQSSMDEEGVLEEMPTMNGSMPSAADSSRLTSDSSNPLGRSRCTSRFSPRCQTISAAVTGPRYASGR
jgi:hypothetical protein